MLFLLGLIPLFWYLPQAVFAFDDNRGLSYNLLINWLIVFLIISFLYLKTKPFKKGEFFTFSFFIIYLIYIYQELGGFNYFSNVIGNVNLQQETIPMMLDPLSSIINKIDSLDGIINLLSRSLILVPFVIYGLHKKWFKSNFSAFFTMFTLIGFIEIVHVAHNVLMLYINLNYSQYFNIDNIILRTTGVLLGIALYQLYKITRPINRAELMMYPDLVYPQKVK